MEEKHVGFRLSPKEKDLLSDLGKKTGRSMSSLLQAAVRNILILDKDGELDETIRNNAKRKID